MPLKKQTVMLLIFAMMASSFAAIFVKLSTAPATITSMYRMYLASLLLLPFAWHYRHDWGRLSTRDWGMIIGAGTLLATHFGLWFESLQLTSVASSTIITAMQPVIAMIGGFIFYRQRTTHTAVIAMLISISGIVFVAWGDFGHADLMMLVGDGLSLLCIIALVGYMFLGQRVISKISFWTYSFLVFLIAGIMLNLFNLVTETPIMHYGSHDWLVFWLLAIFPTLAHVIYNALLRKINPTVISMSMLGEPVGASILAALILGQAISGLQFLGGVVVLLGVGLYLRNTA